MRIYLVSNLLRTNVGRVGLLFYLLFVGIGALASEDPWTGSVERDSLFAHWMRSKSTLPTLIYEMGDFDDFTDRTETESLIRTYGIGGVILKNGGHAEVSEWILTQKKRRTGSLMFTVQIDKIFELPFDNLPDFPSQKSVECISNDSLVYILGSAHADFLKSMSIGHIQISDLPAYYTKHELQKVVSYLKGLSSGGVSYFFMNRASLFLQYHTGWNADANTSILDVNKIAEHGQPGHKTIKKYRKESTDQRLIIGYSGDNIESALSQLARGVNLVVISKQSNSQDLINAILLEGLQNKGYYKQSVKAYFKFLRESQTLETLSDSSEADWKLLQKEFKNKHIVLTQDDDRLLPIRDTRDTRIYTLSRNKTFFKNIVDRYHRAEHLPLSLFTRDMDSLVNFFPANALVFVDLTDFEDSADLEVALEKCDSLNEHRPVLIFQKGHFELLRNSDYQSAMLWSSKESAEDLVAKVQMAFGALAIEGQLPGYLQHDFIPKGALRKAQGRLIYKNSENTQVNRKVLGHIDSLVAQAIREEQMPGCQIMMIKDGEVVYDKNFGYLTYDSTTQVKWDHMYDIASVTKTVATVPALMHRMEVGKVKIEGRLGDYLTSFNNTDKAALSMNDILAHQSGLKAYIPFWRNASYFSDSSTYLYKQKERRRKYNYLPVNWADSIQSWIVDSKFNRLSNLDGTYRYLYSDLGFMLMKDVIEEDCSCSLDQSMDELIYQPMGMNYTTFNPLKRFPKEQMVPTEQDKFFRKELLQGVVHDKNAAILGGVSGHAGLFSNANDLGKYMQMLLQKGNYGGVQYFSDSTIQTFTSKTDPANRRARGWDKPYQSIGNASRYASDESFGHSGFTGTVVWADPRYNLIYIFLSNRIYPDPQNYKLIESNTRTKIHDLMYESFLNSEKKANHGI